MYSTNTHGSREPEELGERSPGEAEAGSADAADPLAGIGEETRIRLAGALERQAAAVRQRWAESLLACGSPLYHTLETGELDGTIQALFASTLDYLRTGTAARLSDLVAGAARRRFGQGFGLTDMETSVTAVRHAVLPTVIAEFDADPAPLAEAVSAVITCEEMAFIRIAETYQEMTAVKLHAAQEDALRAEHDKLVFCREMARVATHEKLILCEQADLPAHDGAPHMVVTTAREVRDARHAAMRLAEAHGWDEDGVYSLQLCIGEAGTNAIRHAGAATFQVWADAGQITFRLADTGPGIDFCRIPTSLQAGYSTGSSLGMGFTLMLELAARIHLATDHRGTVLQIAVDKA